MISPGDALPPFLSPTAPALLRADANAVAPGGLFHGYDRYPMIQAQLGAQRELGTVAGMAFTGSAEVVARHLRDLPDQALRRYGRSDIFGGGAIHGACNVTTPDPVRQCSQRGHVSRDAWAYRLRLDARVPAMAPGLAGAVSVLFVHDLQGWSADALINEGRRTVNLALRFEYRQRYLVEVVFAPIWGGDYNAVTDRDQLAVAVGIRF